MSHPSNSSDDMESSFSYHPLETRLQPSATFLHAGGNQGRYGRVHAQSLAGDSTFGTQFEDPVSAGLPLPEHLSREDVIRSSRHFKLLKPISGSRIKWNLVWLLVIWIFITLPIWLPYVAGCSSSFYVVGSVLIFLNFVWFFAIIFTAYYIYFLYKGMNVDYKLKYSPNTPCYHIIVLTIYKDDMDVVMRTVGSIAKQTEAKRIIMLLAWEGRTPDREARTAQMKEAFKDSFHMLLFSVHPFQLPHEIASKAANANWGLRYVTRHLFQRVGHSNVNHFMVTTCDSDTLFHERYFESLTADYLSMLNANHPETHHTIWQAPLFYNWNLDQSSFITRITGLLRTTMTMGCLIPYSVNPMSCFSFSLSLGIHGGYWHPQIFMDDVGYLLTMQIGVQARVKIRCLPVPVLSGPTSGATWLLDIWEWYVQVRRWAIGTADNFHYMVVKIGNLPFVAALTFTLGYFLYYGIILCSGPLFSINSCVYAAICPDSSDVWSHSVAWVGDYSLAGSKLTPNKLLLLLTLTPYFFYGCMFLLDSIWIRVILKMKEDIGFFRNVVHWLMVGPSLVAYSLSQLHGYNVLAVKGKVGACIHQLAGKATLGTGVGLDGLNKSSPTSVTADPDANSFTASRMADEQFEAENSDNMESGAPIRSGAGIN